MGLFSSQTPPRNRRRTDHGTLSIVAGDLQVHGDLEAEGTIKVEGVVHGNVRSGDQVLVAAGARIEGDVATREAVVGGTVQGNIYATERAELLPSAVVNGNILAARLVVQEGGQVNGQVRTLGEDDSEHQAEGLVPSGDPSIQVPTE